MNLILRSPRSLIVLVVGAVAYAVGSGCACLSWATASPLRGPRNYVGLYRLQAGLHAAGFLALSVAVVLAGWTVAQEPGTPGEERAEMTVGGLAALVVAVGFGRISASTSYDSSGHLIVAVGLALWVPLALVRGVHCIANERRGEADNWPHGILWFATSAGLLLYAIGYDFVPVGPDAHANGATSGTCEAVGALLIAYMLFIARSRGLLSARSAGITAAGVLVLATSSIAYAIVSYLAYGPHSTFDWIKYGFSIQYGLTVLAALTVAVGASAQLHRVTAAKPK
jgi:hypothetical protein